MRTPDPRTIRMVEILNEIADDPSHGYSQRPPSGRWGPDFDCASLVYFAASSAGYPVGAGPEKVRFTGVMTKDFKDAGFELLPFANVGLGDLEIGDILLNLALHAEVYVGEGQVVGAQASETGGYVGEAGDQTGTEITRQPAYIYKEGWDYVLRPPAGDDDEPTAHEAEEEGDEQDMAYPYSNSTWGQGNWTPNTGMGNMPRVTAPNWMPPMNYGGYSQGNVGQMNGYAQAGGYQQPYQQQYQQGYPQGYGNQNDGGYPQGGQGKHLIHVNDFNEVRDVHVGPGECVPVFIGEGRHMALKSADQEGFTNMRVFELNECTEEMAQGNWMPGMGRQEQQGFQQDQPRVQQSQGVSRQEFEQLKESLSNVESILRSGSGYAQGNSSQEPMGAQANGSNAQSSRGSNGGSRQSGRSNGGNS